MQCFINPFNTLVESKTMWHVNTLPEFFYWQTSQYSRWVKESTRKTLGVIVQNQNPGLLIAMLIWTKMTSGFLFRLFVKRKNLHKTQIYNTNTHWKAFNIIRTGETTCRFPCARQKKKDLEDGKMQNQPSTHREQRPCNKTCLVGASGWVPQQSLWPTIWVFIGCLMANEPWMLMTTDEWWISHTDNCFLPQRLAVIVLSANRREKHKK